MRVSSLIPSRVGSISFVLHSSQRVLTRAFKIGRISGGSWLTQVSVVPKGKRSNSLKTAGRKLALKLVGALQLLPAASILPSEDGKGPLSSDIALLYARLSSNQMEFKHTAQLLRDIILPHGQPHPLPHPLLPPSSKRHGYGARAASRTPPNTAIYGRCSEGGAGTHTLGFLVSSKPSSEKS